MIIPNLRLNWFVTGLLIGMNFLGFGAGEAFAQGTAKARSKGGRRR